MKKNVLKILSLITVIALVSGAFASCGKKDNENGDADSILADYEEDKSKDSDTYHVAMSVKNYGVIIVKLDAKKAPETVKNFIKLVRDGFYDGLTFHRIVSNFMIQGGDPKADGTGGAKDKIYGEFSSNGWFMNDISHKRGVISMARAQDPDSASSQFFICNADSEGLDGQYAAFGSVVEGMDIVDKITEKTVKYADSYSGTIQDKSRQAQISEMKVIVYNG